MSRRNSAELELNSVLTLRELGRADAEAGRRPQREDSGPYMLGWRRAEAKKILAEPKAPINESLIR